MAHGPLMLAGGLLLLGGLMMFTTGLIGEMMMRTYFESQDRRIYAVREILTRKAARSARRHALSFGPAARYDATPGRTRR